MPSERLLELETTGANRLRRDQKSSDLTTMLSLARWLKRRSFTPPKHLLGADLFWWQASPNLQTLITIYTPTITTPEIHDLTLTFVLFDPSGTPITKWQRDLQADETIVIDSSRIQEIVGAKDLPEEGTLAAFLSSRLRPSKKFKKNYGRLYSLMDWYSTKGELVSLHNDQSVINKDTPIEFTEIVFLESQQDKNFLVILNGNKPQSPNSITLEIKNHRGDQQKSTYMPPMQPYSLHKLHLAEMFGDLESFCDGQHATLSGTFNCRGLFTRPYVMTQSKYLCGYHGGDRYEWDGLPSARYKQLGRGEVNPMAVLNTHDLTSHVNLLNTHGHLEDDFWVDARLYDEEGTLVAEKQRWLLARRNQLSRGDIRELLPDPDQTLIGHIALNFSPDDKALYPRRLQALLEYRTPNSTARAMAWSDIWNAPQRLANDQVLSRAFYRVLYKPPINSYLAITNCGITQDYSRHVHYRILLKNTEGQTLTYEGTVAPQGTVYASIDTFFPNVKDFLGPACAGVALVESQEDLALMHFSQNQASGVYSAEHFMSLYTFHNGKWYWPCGS